MLKGSAIQVLRNVYNGENEKQKGTISFFKKVIFLNVFLWHLKKQTIKPNLKLILYLKDEKNTII